MRRPRTEQQVFRDTFADLSVDEQEAELKLLGELHRQARRAEKQRKMASQNGQGESTEERETK